MEFLRDRNGFSTSVFIFYFFPNISAPLGNLSVGEGDVAKVITGIIIKNSWPKNFFKRSSKREVIESSRGKMPLITIPSIMLFARGWRVKNGTKFSTLAWHPDIRISFTRAKLLITNMIS